MSLTFRPLVRNKEIKAFEGIHPDHDSPNTALQATFIKMVAEGIAKKPIMPTMLDITNTVPKTCWSLDPLEEYFPSYE